MGSPALAELPPPPPGTTGWPWDAHAQSWTTSDAFPEDVPRIAIVTPSFNQGPFIEETIRSVLLQGYPNLQYFVVDGGSTDETVAILQKYSAWLSGWRSEADDGQADALNIGFRGVEADLYYFLNSDDVLKPSALRAITDRAGINAKSRSPHWWAFVVEDFDVHGTRLYDQARPLDLKSWIEISGAQLHQPGVVWNRAAFKRVFPFDASYCYAFDRKAFMTLIADGTFPDVVSDTCIAGFRIHEASKTMNESVAGKGFEREFVRLSWEFLSQLPYPLQLSAINAIATRAIALHRGSREFFAESPLTRLCILLRVASEDHRSLRSKYLLGALRRTMADCLPWRW